MDLAKLWQIINSDRIQHLLVAIKKHSLMSNNNKIKKRVPNFRV